MEWTLEQREQFAELMRSGRERTGLKQYEVSERLGIAQGTISQLERGPYAGMRWWDVVRLLRFYGLPTEVVEAALGLDTPSVMQEDIEAFVLASELGGLSEGERGEVRRVVRLFVRGLRAQE